ncbi:heavy-metal-associated domain-containing protein [Tepidibacter formicigenes]|jgi:copper ion binding protein|uniref:Copper ion binding protein n=1 Tax=Tepidibacter formicigenes DSM 15518 TaxID=1123349 RepID=A0A1M6JEQ5_9FIRM|nr:heavy metal-associated domain-containing protein [Tepidibacter formicigenes]SHJ45158.1 copper ion binding protein [Tepidibacter formicigenes DSM 15518]
MEKKIFIEGMSCGNCVKHVKEALKEIDGVKEVEVNLENKYAKITIDKEVSNDTIKEIIYDAGYDVKNIEE